MSARQDNTVWRQLSESALGRFGGAAIEKTTRAARDSRVVSATTRANNAWAHLAAPIKHRAAGTVTLAAVATHVAMMLPQHPPGAWWLILPSLAGAFGVVLIALSFLAPRAGSGELSQRPIRVLAISPIPEEGAGCRFRVAQFIPYLNANGFDVTLSPLYTTEFFRQVYKPGNLLKKSAGFAALSLKQLYVLSDGRPYDVMLLYREIFPIGPAFMEWLLSMPGHPPIVFDFDDAIFLPSTSEANQLIAALKVPSKVATIVRRSTEVVAGNDYLADYARQFNPAVTTIPTCVDTAIFRPRDGHATLDQRGPVIGWIGSPTTADYIRGLGPVLREVATRHRFVLRVSGTGAAVEFLGVTVDNPAWALADEIELFRNLDIGVYPLVDDAWARGKCGFKAIEFMACGVPVVASAVGVNREIIEDGVNGFLASTSDEWIAKLGRLIEDPALRAKFGAAGRRTNEDKYSLHVNAPKLAGVIRRAAATTEERG